MKCKKCGYRYEGNECPNCKMENIFSGNKSKEAEHTEQNFDNPIIKKLKSSADYWIILAIIGLVLALIFIIAGLILSKPILISIGALSLSVAVLSLLFYNLTDIRRLITILINKK